MDSGSSYDPDHTLFEARQVYFERYGFDNGGYDDRWVKLKMGPIPFYFPNIPARVIAVRYHDLHHIVTGYPANWRGEAEIGAWEIASGCRHHWPAWILNLDAMAIGLVIAPRKVYEAFMRGRYTHNLYAHPFDDRLLSATVGAMARELQLDRAVPAATAADRLSFVLWSLLAIVTVTLPPLTMLAAILFVAVRVAG